MQSGVAARRQHTGLGPEIGPGLLETIACLWQSFAPRVRLQHLQSPSESGSEPQRSLAIEPPVIQVARCHAWHNAHQTFWLCRGRQQLSCSLIGEAIHPYAAVRFLTSAQPGDGFRAVAPLVTKWIELAFGISAPADILDHDVISMPGKPHGMCIDDGRCNIPPVRLAHE